MNIFFAGSEDIDFATNGAMVFSTTNKRTGWSRGSMNGPQNVGGSPAKSFPFSAGAQTSAWLSCQVVTGVQNAAEMMAGLSLSGTNKTLGFGSDTSNGLKLCIFKYDGTTRTQLANEGGATIPGVVGTMFRIDMQVINYGVSCNVLLYINNVAVINYTGDVTVSGMSNFDTVAIFPHPFNNTPYYYSEIFVTDTDTRSVQGLQTLAPVATGTVSNWTNNAVGNINLQTYTDASPASSNTAAQDQEYTVTTPTPAAYSVAGVVIKARMAKSASPTTNTVQLGYKSGGGAAFGTGSTKSVTTSYTTYDQIDTINPGTSAAFTPSDLSALQLCMRSA